MNSYVIYASAGFILLVGAALTYAKAEADGRNGSGWGLFALFTGPIAWIAYAATTDREAPLGHMTDEDPEFSPNHTLHASFARNSSQPVVDIKDQADKNFSDPFVERLITKGDYKRAKEAIHGMIETAKEAHDVSMIASYEVYAHRVRHMELENVKRDAPAPVAGPPMDFVDNTSMIGHASHHLEGEGQTALI